MALTEGDKAVVREIAFEAAKTIGDEVKDAIMTGLRLHQAECPVKVEVEAKINQAKGARWAFGLVIAVVSAAIGAMATLFSGLIHK